ncbi:excinuclease ABC subunit UvrC [Tuwongella immobilis]|uniref:Excinuclease ABC subunit C n=1 Tax=Tuwongella immobilis TaxID=692036 RepID=A0A6C2YN26_9BACT|nr:excinuclease ABC subunit UvrC [Tuwongella immobilis]VIP02784.1 excinuclease abc subunit c : UvrABC system protein C OS=Planctomyces maris DSM 8797 GN=PM8797T_05435 PE=4 SV=1: GIY-YIG: UVR: UvrC_HhH_N [Tuwongella immobilis]VTS02440.1 excinuclease abc subunit c : UvrABC system protein C OS=Planctomyces maris DSM 8797 GN=PM8797T_05435 PE=4 SV=1: GIY-YIG: UVR: UvrC_HhH_N [Tuwongella immobilis]
MSSVETPEPNALPPHEKVKTFPTTPGVYLMKDAEGKVIYVGKAKVLRNRASHYFTQLAAEEQRTRELVKHIADLDYIQTDTEVDALLLESRLVKDLMPRFNIDLKDDKSFPYLQIRMREEFPRVEFTRNPKRRGVKLYGPFTSARSLRMAIQVLQRIFQFRTCKLDINSSEERWRWFRPCLLASIRQCTAPCNLRVTPEEYRKQIRSLRMVMEGKKGRLIREMERDMLAASEAMLFEKAARLRDEIAALQKLELRGEAKRDIQPHVFHIDPKKGLRGLKKILGLKEVPRTIEGVDIAHLGGQDTVASLVSFLDGIPFKNGYRKYKIRTVEGIDDFASIREIISRRFRSAANDESIFPDILLIDGGKGQLNAARDVFKMLGVEPPCLISLAKQEEEIFRPGESESIKLSRSSEALRILQSVRDEAHRFAQHYLHTLRKRRMFEE